MTTIDALSAFSSSGSATSTPTNANEAGAADRFLKLLVAQMQNQDPLNPLDNAQVTSQMAQINMVSGIDKLNTTMQGVNGQMVQMQMLQGASLVGRDITVEGTQLSRLGSGADSVGVGGFELISTADRVQVEVLTPSGRVVDRLELGTQTAGRHGFEWAGAALPEHADLSGYTFRISATAGTQAVSATPLMLDRVASVRSVGGQLTLDTLRSGPLPYTAVLAVN